MVFWTSPLKASMRHGLSAFNPTPMEQVMSFSVDQQDLSTLLSLWNRPVFRFKAPRGERDASCRLLDDVTVPRDFVDTHFTRVDFLDVIRGDFVEEVSGTLTQVVSFDKIFSLSSQGAPYMDRFAS